MAPGDHQPTNAPGTELNTPPGRCAFDDICAESRLGEAAFHREEGMNDSDADIQMLAQWIAHAAGFMIPPTETQAHARYPDVWRSELNELVLLGRMVMRNYSMETITKRALQEAMIDGEAQLYYLTFSYLPVRGHGSSAEVM